MNKKLILIVGLQKSGTTLLFRLLQQTDLVTNPFKGEGDKFWGNVPPFTPKASPAGKIYQQYNGEMGHEIEAKEATQKIKEKLHRRINRLKTQKGIIANKNPYNTVRLPWLREIFPDAIIIAMVRDAVPNVFSLLKKYTPHTKSGIPPENGWWGTKPKDWNSLVQEDKIEQCAMQWKNVNTKLWQDRQYVDHFLHYQNLTSQPETIIRHILQNSVDESTDMLIDSPDLSCFDDEYKRGAGLRSKNRDFKKTSKLDTFHEEKIEILPFSPQNIKKISDICGDTEALLRELV